jgi:hypothetical protein
VLRTDHPSFAVPAVLFGTAADVTKAARRAVTALRKGGALDQVFGETMVRVADVSGLVVLDRQWSLVPANERNVHLDVLFRQLTDAFLKKDEEPLLLRATAEALEHAWSFAGLAGGQNFLAVRAAAAQVRFLEAARRHWRSLVSVGPRYTHGSNVGSELSTMNTLVGFCLARQGAEASSLLPLTPARLDELLASLPGFRVLERLRAGDASGARDLLVGREDIPLCTLAEHFFAFDLEDFATRTVEELAPPDPHGIVRDWLRGRGNPNRRVR